MKSFVESLFIICVVEYEVDCLRITRLQLYGGTWLIKESQKLKNIGFAQFFNLLSFMFRFYRLNKFVCFISFGQLQP